MTNILLFTKYAKSPILAAFLESLEVQGCLHELEEKMSSVDVYSHDLDTKHIRDKLGDEWSIAERLRLEEAHFGSKKPASARRSPEGHTPGVGGCSPTPFSLSHQLNIFTGVLNICTSQLGNQLKLRLAV